MEKPPIIERMANELFSNENVVVDILREDKLHPEISGNKYWKLKYYLKDAKEKKCDTLISFGGAYSNHIHALAFAGKLYGFKTIGIIRGEELESKPRNPTLQDCERYGMNLQFISRNYYKLKDTANFLSDMKDKYRDSLVIPEGGGCEMGEMGVIDMIQRVNNISQYHYIVVSGGTGTTAAGIAKGVKDYNTEVIIVPALNLTETVKEINSRLVTIGCKKLIMWDTPANWSYGKLNNDLLEFSKTIYNTYGLMLDPVYTTKSFKLLLEKISQNYFNSGSKILFIHTGGLQGWRGFKPGLSDKPI
ncbi:1-aminocyclopropane-1-carboxylate deaminase/D-cysteine desulfhydrase [Marinigracilibium pacificum]|uniref:Pyridoxal-phosphate dependent enzyme n=1 Tax=Marinigracilibium pacificum TaxID=2729599 RepID=A0A848IRI0_9BACT|nr:pyridoxal-phosphate dependent enzyme [Marinigracilibium pacificum]NMM46957.1 pyridoxal-phosphate dependent enzyme [Marinigracilibium pacificum]